MLNDLENKGSHWDFVHHADTADTEESQAQEEEPALAPTGEDLLRDLAARKEAGEKFQQAQQQPHEWFW